MVEADKVFRVVQAALHDVAHQGALQQLVPVRHGDQRALPTLLDVVQEPHPDPTAGDRRVPGRSVLVGEEVPDCARRGPGQGVGEEWLPEAGRLSQPGQRRPHLQLVVRDRVGWSHRTPESREDDHLAVHPVSDGRRQSGIVESVIEDAGVALDGWKG